MAEAAASCPATSRFGGCGRQWKRRWTLRYPCDVKSRVQVLAMSPFSSASRFRNGGSEATALFMGIGRAEERLPGVVGHSSGILVHTTNMYGTKTARKKWKGSIHCGLADITAIDHTTSIARDANDAATAVAAKDAEEGERGGNGAATAAVARSFSSWDYSLDGNNGLPGHVGRAAVQDLKLEKATAAVLTRSRSQGGGGALLLASIALVMSLCNADRVVMSVAVMPLAAAHSWSSAFLGIIQSSFLWGYVISSAVGGGLADRYGGKQVMAVGVALWSLATLLTPWAAGQSTAVLLAIRAFFGLAEGVAIPTMNLILSRGFPPNQRASAVGLSMAGFHMGNVVGFLLSPILLAQLGVFGPFAIFAAAGFLWLCLCLPAIPNDGRQPTERATAKQQHRHRHHPLPPATAKASPLTTKIASLLSEMPSWAIIFANVTNNWGYFVLLSWMPVYFKTVFDVKLKEAAWFSAIPWALMAVSGCIAGLSSDYLIKSGYPLTRVRKIMQSIGFIGPGIALMCLNYAKTPSIAAALLTGALSLSSFSQAGFLLNMQDIAPNSAGLLHGIANSFGTVAAIISTIGTGYFVQWLGSFQAFLTLTSFLYFATAIFWCVHATADQVFF